MVSEWIKVYVKNDYHEFMQATRASATHGQ